MGWDDKLGTVAAGKLADFVILSKDPLSDIHIVEDRNNVVTVIKDGKIVKNIRKTGKINEEKEEIEIQ